MSDFTIKNYIFIKKSVASFEQVLHEMGQKFKNSSDLSEKIFYFREVEKKSLREIASNLGYSYQYVRRIHSNTLELIEKTLDTC